MRKLLLILIFIPFLASSQDLTGFWRGKLTQDTGGYAPEYSLEVNIVQKKKNISGQTKAYFGKVVVAKLNFEGYFSKDSIYLNEYKEGIIEEIVPIDWLLCIKKLILSYNKNAVGIETLTGRWNGVAYPKKSKINEPFLRDSLNNIFYDLPCIPGLIYLSKNDSLHIKTKEPTQIVNFPDTLGGTKVYKIQEIEVENQIIQISISDYEKVDGDKVSVFLNRISIADNVGVRRVPTTFTVALNGNYITNELLIFAENLGKIPPNTSLLSIKDGDKEYKVYISSDLKNTAAVYLKHKKQ